jgi:hypothetical protein
VADAPLNPPSKATVASFARTRLFLRAVFIEELSTECNLQICVLLDFLVYSKESGVASDECRPVYPGVGSFTGKCLTGVVRFLSAEYEQRTSTPFDNNSECRAE